MRPRLLPCRELGPPKSVIAKKRSSRMRPASQTGSGDAVETGGVQPRLREAGAEAGGAGRAHLPQKAAVRRPLVWRRET